MSIIPMAAKARRRHPVADATPLAAGIEDLAGRAIAAQAHALVLQRQVDADPDGERERAVTGLRHHQQQLRRQADYYLDGLLPEVIRGVGNVRALHGLVDAMQGAGATDAGEQVELVSAVIDEMDAYRGHAAELLASVSAEAARVDTVVASVTCTADARIRALDDEDGGIARTRKAIEERRLAIGKHVEAIVDSAHDIGKGVKRLVTGVLTVLGLGSDEKSPDATGVGKPGPVGTSDGTPPGPPARKPADRTDVAPEKTVPVKPFPIESVSAIEGDVGQHVDAVVQLQRDLDARSELYQQLFRQEAVLALTIAIGDQASAYATALGRLKSAAENMDACWRDLIATSEALLSQLEAIAAGEAGAAPRLDKVFDASWKRLGHRVEAIRAALAGERNAIPRVAQPGK